MWLLYGCFIRVVLDGKAKAGKSTEAHISKTKIPNKPLNLLIKTDFPPEKKSGGR
jgi:hypothetical protein